MLPILVTAKDDDKSKIKDKLKKYLTRRPSHDDLEKKGIMRTDDECEYSYSVGSLIKVKSHFDN